MQPFTNIHVAEKNLRESAQSADTTLPRLRSVTNDPAREYAQRPGEVEKLPDSVAALILCKKGYSKVTRNGIRVEGDFTAKPLNFWHEHSITIQEKAGTNEKVLWVLNRLSLDVIHILKPDGEYVESIPLDEKAEWFNQDHLKILGAKRRSQNRSIERIAALHLPDSEAAAEAATSNDAAMKSIVHTFPHDDHKAQPQGKARSIEPETVRENLFSESRHSSHVTRHSPDLPGQRSNLGGVSADALEKGAETVELPSRAEGRARSSARAAFGTADRLHEIQRHLADRRQTHEARQQVRSSAARFGAAAKSQIPSGSCRTTAIQQPTEIEEW